MSIVRNLFLVGSMVAPWVAASGCLPRSGESPPDSADAAVEIALLLDLSGPQSSLGRPAKNGFALALHERAGSDSPALAATTIDTKTDDEATRTAAEETASKVASGAGFTNNESLLIAAPIYQRAGTPFLSIGATDPALPELVGDRIFLVCFGDNVQAAAAAEFAHREFGATTAILWDSNTQYTRTLPRYFRTRFEQLGGEVLLDESFGGCDLSAAGARIAGLPKPPAFVYLAAMPECVGDQIASLRASGVGAPIVGGDGLDTPDVLESGSGPTSDVWFTTHAWLSAETGTQRARKFVRAYEEAYGEPPTDAFAALGYDAARLLIDAVGRAQDASPEQIAAALEATRDFEGVTGRISFTEHRHVPSKTVWVVEVADGERSLAGSLIPERTPPPLPEQ